MSKTVAIRESIQTITNYPKKLVIYLIPSSQYYWVRVFYNGRYHTKTTQTADPAKAKRFAIKFYESVLANSHDSLKGSKNKAFSVIGRKYLDSIKDNQRKSAYDNDSSRFENGIIQFFNEQDISSITNAQISNFLSELVKRGLSPATQKHYLVVLRKILKFAVANDLTEKLPLFPKVSGFMKTDQKRDYFTFEEYKDLVSASEKLSSDRISVRGVPITLEMKFLIQFMVNSFIRPSDLRVIKHKHVKVREEGGDQWITLSHPATKTTATEVQAMPATVGIYRQLCKVHQSLKQPMSSDDFIFFPTYKNRDTAMAIIARIFRQILNESSIDKSTGKNLTLYSLRHTSIMLRLIKGDVNTLALARNARTSQQMIDRFYAAHLTTEHVRKQLHGFTENKTAHKNVKAAKKVESISKKLSNSSKNHM
jgi:site-specific recombinase XerD